MTEQVETDSLLLVGRVWRAHGVRGEVKVMPETDDPTRFTDLRIVYVGSSPVSARVLRVESVRLQATKRGTIIIMKLKGIDSREQVDTLRRANVFARETDLPALADDEFFIHDLIGLHVVTDKGEPVGTVEEVMTVPAQEILVVSRQGKEAVLIPAVGEFVVEMDLDERRIVVRPIEGLLD
jgi:16S rRNA processing protein RimM